MVRQNTYHPKLNLVTAIGYRKEADRESAASHEYGYDALMRPVQRRDSWNVATPATLRDFTYNGRSELIEDRISPGGSFIYSYDNIGNRRTARELEEEVSYDANGLNQYVDIAGGEEHFKPVYDADGNQATIRTSTGIWEVSYDANDRPVTFTSQDGRAIVTCGYDYQGRRFEKKVSVNGAVSGHSWFLYRGYLQVAQLDLRHPEPVLVKSYLWDPTEPEATRILMMTCWQKNGMKVKEHLYFMHDVMKNVTSIFDGQHTRRARYEYAPFGSPITEEGDMARENKFRFSCEYTDDELGLVYYNYRHLNPADGRWINRDPIQEQGGWNLYAFIRNASGYDVLGLWKINRNSKKITACACAEENDTWASLAQAVSLEAIEISKWVRGYTPQPKTDVTYQIPNTIIQAWYGDVGWIGRRYAGWDLEPGGDFHIVQKFHTSSSLDSYFNELGNLAIQYSQISALYGVYLHAHGNEDGISWGKKGDLILDEHGKPIVTDGSPARYNPHVWHYDSTELNYKLARVSFRACKSEKAKKYCASNSKVCKVFCGKYFPLPIGWGIDI